MNILRKVLLLLLLFPWTIVAQELSVKSFSEKPTDLSASTAARVDNNGVPCALVKVQLASSGALFEGNVMGDVAYKTSEYWVYMPKGSKRLTIKHEGYLPLNVEFVNYGISSLESKTTYQLVITGVVAKAQGEDENYTPTGWIMLDSDPSGAAVYIEDNYVGTTPYDGKYPYGNYNYRLEQSLYHAATGSVSLQSSKEEKTVKLTPAFGTIRVTGNDKGSEVILDGKTTGQTVPCTLNEVPSGSHQISVQKDKHAPFRQEVTVRDGEESLVMVVFEARFATVTINTLQGAEILVNGKSEGETHVERELMEGYYDVEVRLAHHKPATRQIQVEAGKVQEITLNPIPIYGSLDVLSTPRKATITINGKSYGETPNTIDHLLEGEYTVVVSKDGFGKETKTVTIRDGQTTTVNVAFNSSNGSIRSDVSTARKVKDKHKNILMLTFTPTCEGSDLFKDMSFGLLYARRIGGGRMGWYVHGSSNFKYPSTNGMFDASELSQAEIEGGSDFTYTSSHTALSAGMELNVGSVQFYAGAGYGSRNYIINSEERGSIIVKDNSHEGLLCEGMVGFTASNFAMSVGVSTIGFKNLFVQMGLGISF